MDGISIREFARLDGCNDKLVRRALQNGHLIANPDGKISRSLVGTGWRRSNADKMVRTADTIAPGETLEQAAARIVAEQGGELLSKAEAERLKENCLAQLRRIELERAEESVAPVDDMAAMIVAEYARLRTRLIAIPAKVASRAAALRSPSEVQALVATEINQALEELSFDGGGGSGEDASRTLRSRAFAVQGPTGRRAA